MRLFPFAILASSFVIISTTLTSAPGDTVYVKANNVNIRLGPGRAASILMRINLGHKLMEIGRQGEWVEVGIDRTGGKTGWIHRSLIGPQFPGGGTTAPLNAKFDRFRAAVENLNSNVYRMARVSFFTNVENLGDGIVQLRATNAWLSASRQRRQRNLDTLFDLWDAADGSGLPIMVQIVDRHGNVVMRKARK